MVANISLHLHCAFHTIGIETKASSWVNKLGCNRTTVSVNLVHISVSAEFHLESILLFLSIVILHLTKTKNIFIPSLDNFFPIFLHLSTSSTNSFYSTHTRMRMVSLVFRKEGNLSMSHTVFLFDITALLICLCEVH